MIGFEELGSVDSFSTATLELRLLHTGLGYFYIYIHDLIVAFQVLSEKMKISRLLSNMHELWHPTERAYAKIAMMMMMMMTLTFEYCTYCTPPSR
jgi:pilus assembly protein TadC